MNPQKLSRDSMRLGQPVIHYFLENTGRKIQIQTRYEKQTIQKILKNKKTQNTF